MPRWYQSQAVRLSGRFARARSRSAAPSSGTNCGEYALREIILNRENIFKCPIISFRPNVSACSTVSELGRESNPTCLSPGTPFQYVCSLKVASSLPNILGFSIVTEHGISCHHVNPPNAGEGCDEVLCDPVRKILLFRVAT